jgi:hypothetical protein
VSNTKGKRPSNEKALSYEKRRTGITQQKKTLTRILAGGKESRTELQFLTTLVECDSADPHAYCVQNPGRLFE